MLTPEDIKNLTEYQLEVYKDVFVTKEDFNKVDKGLGNVQTSLEGLALEVKNISDTMPTINHRLEKTEDWIEQTAPKVGVNFDR